MIRIGNLSPVQQRAARVIWKETVERAGPSYRDVFDANSLPRRPEERLLLQRDLEAAAMEDGNPTLSMTELRLGIRRHVEGWGRTLIEVPDAFRPEIMQLHSYGPGVLDAYPGPARTGEQVTLKSDDGTLEIQLLKVPGRGGRYFCTAIDWRSYLPNGDTPMLVPHIVDEPLATALLPILDALSTAGPTNDPGQRLIKEFLAQAESIGDNDGRESHTALLNEFVQDYLADGNVKDAARVAEVVALSPNPETRLEAWTLLVALYQQLGNAEGKAHAEFMVDVLGGSNA